MDDTPFCVTHDPVPHLSPPLLPALLRLYASRESPRVESHPPCLTSLCHVSTKLLTRIVGPVHMLVLFNHMLVLISHMLFLFNHMLYTCGIVRWLDL